jgi:hypothetical protein
MKTCSLLYDNWWRSATNYRRSRHAIIAAHLKDRNRKSALPFSGNVSFQSYYFDVLLPVRVQQLVDKGFVLVVNSITWNLQIVRAFMDPL